MSTVVVNIKHESADVYIGRGRQRTHMLNTPIGRDGWLGNPFSVEEFGDKAIDMFVEVFEARLADDMEFRRAVLALRGKKLGCYCKPKRCHGDHIAQWIDGHSE